MADQEIYSQGLYRAVSALSAILRNDAELRGIRAGLALQAKYYDQPVGGITGATIYGIAQAQSGSEKFSALVITFETASGLGRYRIDGIDPSPTRGIEIPAGGGTLTIGGHDNIKNFRMQAQAAATLLFARYVFL